jgi:hypothetical protein
MAQDSAQGAARGTVGNPGHVHAACLIAFMAKHASSGVRSSSTWCGRRPLWNRNHRTLTPARARDLLEILDDRCGRSSTLVATQIPLEEGHACIPETISADAVLDRLVHNAYRLELKGESMRRGCWHLQRKPPSPLQLPAS